MAHAGLTIHIIKQMEIDKKAGGILRLNINVEKVDKSALFKGKKGTYLDVTVLMHPDTNEYGDHGMIVQDLGKERREAGEQSEILGNAKWAMNPHCTAGWINQNGESLAPAKKNDAVAVDEDEDDDLPF